ncbi:MAG: hypothetical protein JWQ63_81 [Mucilaginibacter sp.]|nr:hypothetical protein [Mucilaginibacter sp.]
MKKKLYLIISILLSAAVLSLSSCLKNSNNYIDFSKAGTIVEFPKGGQAFFSADAVTDPGDTITKQFAVTVASNNAPTTATAITLAIDSSIVTSYDAANPAINYLTMPTGSFVFTTTSATIPAGQRTAIFSVTFYKHLLDPSKSYMLPIKIASAGGLKISGNQNIHYYHFIGNDFAGNYEQFYTRWNNADTTTAPSTPRTDLGAVIISPVSPSEFTVATGYYTTPNYDVTFIKTGSGASATYSNWAIKFLPADIAAGTLWATNITVVTSPMFVPSTITFNPNTQYTYAQSLQLFRFYFKTASRAIIDDYVHL